MKKVRDYLRVKQAAELLGVSPNTLGNVPASVESEQRFRPIFYATSSFVSSLFLLTRASSAATS
jgi:hypothetical protein